MSVPGTPSDASAVARPGALRGIKDRLRAAAHAVLDPVVGALVDWKISADVLTVTGLLLSFGAGLLFFWGRPRLAALVLLIGGLCDILDGQVARRSGGETRFGAFFDSTLDRLAEAAVLLGLAGYYVRNLLMLWLEPTRMLDQMSFDLLPVAWGVLALSAMVALVGSFLVSYTRARAEGLGLDCKVGWFERPERLALLILAGALQKFWALSAAIYLLAILSFITAAQRVAHVWKITRGSGQDR